LKSLNSQQEEEAATRSYGRRNAIETQRLKEERRRLILLFYGRSNNIY
jgi:hypothetical protein